MESLEMKLMNDREKAQRLQMYLSRKAFGLYINNFTFNVEPTVDKKSCEKVKVAMWDQHSTKKMEEEMMRETTTFELNGGDIRCFVNKASRITTQANFNAQLTFGLFMVSMKADQSLVQFVLYRRDKNHQDAKRNFLKDDENKRLLLSRTLSFTILDVSDGNGIDGKNDNME